MSMDVAEPGLRERKRLATRRAIQLAVLTLVTERGIDNVTVDEVSRIADVSPRTFFNYFPSKEAALIGDLPTLPEGEPREAFIAAGPGADILTGIGDLLAAATFDADGDRDLTTLRRALLRGHPELFAVRMAGMRHFEDELAELVSLRLAADDPALASEPVELSQKARLVTLLAFAAMKHAWACWADTGGTIDLATRLRTSFAEMRLVLAQN